MALRRREYISRRQDGRAAHASDREAGRDDHGRHQGLLEARRIVLDGFGGSGSTLIAAEKTKRKARLVEYEPRYVDMTIKRWEALTGKKATLADTGETFGSAAQRLGTSLPADGEAAA